MRNVKQYFMLLAKSPKYKVFLRLFLLLFIFLIIGFSTSIKNLSSVSAANSLSITSLMQTPTVLDATSYGDGVYGVETYSPMGTCPSGGDYCGGSVGQNSNNLYHCNGSGSNPTLKQTCSNGCQVNPPGVNDVCKAASGPCPSGGDYCGGSVGQNSNNLYNCSGSGANPTLKQSCSNGCHVNPPGTNDVCNPSGPCPTAGDYCGGSVGQDPNNLYSCSGTGANPSLKQTCSVNGCQINPSGTSDVCKPAGACPSGGDYCGGSVGQDPNNLYSCSATGANPSLKQTCSVNGCQVNPPGTSDVCKAAGACPSGGDYCGGSVGQDPNNLYSCSATGANPSLKQTCSVNGCQINPPGTSDVCKAAGACPSAGDYCGVSVGQNTNNLYSCSATGANPSLKQTCSVNGCQINPPGTPDVCKASGACPSGGDYCGGSVGQNANNLYSCSGTGANPTLKQSCNYGCQVNPPGTSDICKLNGACPTSGDYCGGSVGQNANNLYNCSVKGADPVLKQSCNNGCQTNIQGVADICKPNGACPTGGDYCGVSVGQNSNNLYSCLGSGAVPTLKTTCSNGCRVNPAGTPDVCNAVITPATNCPSGGDYCGATVGQNVNNLYMCPVAGATPQLKQVCNNGCHINPTGTNDVCSGTTSTFCPSGNGLYCGGSVGLNSNNLYQCTNGIYQLSQVCSNGCQRSPYGVADKCLVPNPTGGSTPDGNQVGDNQLISNTISHLTWPFGSASSYANKSPWSLTLGSGKNPYHWDSDYYAQDWATGDQNTTCNADIFSPANGTVIFAGCLTSDVNPTGDPNGDCSKSDYGKQVVIQFRETSNLAIRIAHLNSLSVKVGNTVLRGITKIGQIGNTGSGGPFNCHAHIVTYKNINTDFTTGITGLDRLKLGRGLGINIGALANKFADSFVLDAATAKSDQFSFPLQNVSDYKVEPGFRFGSGPIYTWKNCDGGLSYNTSGRNYHAGIDLIGVNAKGTEEVISSSDVALCKAGSLGATVMAAGDGVITEANPNTGDGGRVTIKHTLSDGQVVYSVYMHINIASGIVNGNSITRGTKIGTVGNYSNNPHLHFEMRNFPDWTRDYGYTDSFDPTTKGYFDPCDFINQHGGAVPSTCSNVHQAGGTITAFNSDIALVIPQDATNQDLFVGIYRNKTTAEMSGLSLASNPYQLTAQTTEGTEVTNFSKNLSLQLSYNPDLLLGRSEDNLQIAYFNTSLNKWINLPSIVDKVKKIITALTPHFSQYAVVIQNYTPVVAQIPGQTITTGDNFATINLASYGSDPNTGDVITWSYSGNSNISVSITDNVATLTYPQGWSGLENITFKATDISGASASKTSTFKVNTLTDLLSAPWHITGNNTSSNMYQAIDPALFAGKTTLRIKYDLHGLTASSGVDSAIVFDQNGGWKWISLTSYGVNGMDGIQSVDIPLSDFKYLNLITGSSMFHMRFWYPSSYTVDVYSVQLIGQTVINKPPVITSTPITSVNENSLYSYDVNAVDPENKPLTYSLTQYKTGMTINASTGLITWMSTYNDAGTYTIIVKVSDGTNSVNQNYNLVVNNVNRAPVLTQIPGQTITSGQSFATINLVSYATDPDGNVITWSYSGNTNITVIISNNVATLTYLGTWVGGTENITFTATDSLGASNSSLVTFSVNLPVLKSTPTLIPRSLIGVNELYKTIGKSY